VFKRLLIRGAVFAGVVLGTVLLVASCGVSLWESAAASQARKDREAKLRAALAPMVADVPQVDWVEFNDGNVYVGLRERPPDLSSRLRVWALEASRAIGDSVCVWAVEGERPGWRPGDGPRYERVTARRGKIED
jgi:hypothetical protein